MLNLNSRRKFSKDFGLPIAVLEDPYFEYTINLLGGNEKLQLLYDEIEKFGSGDDNLFFAYIKNITDKIISDIDISNLEKDQLNNYNSTPYPNTSVYNPNNIEKNIISIDLVKANYQALKQYDTNLVLNSKNYEDFIRIYTESEYITKSKQVRQYIFGNLAPKKQQKIQKWIMNQISLDLPYDVFAMSSDEIIIYDEDNIDIFKDHLSQFPWEFKIRSFKIEYIQKINAYRRIFPDATYDFKEVPREYLLQCIKYFRNEDMNATDLTFTHQSGKLAMFIESIFS